MNQKYAKGFGLESRHRLVQDRMRREESKRDMLTVLAIAITFAIFFALAAQGVI